MIKILTFLAINFFLLNAHASSIHIANEPPRIKDCILELQYGLDKIDAHHILIRKSLQNRLIFLDGQLIRITDVDKLVWIIKEKILIQDSLNLLNKNESVKNCHIRYDKGIKIIRALYEKTLALDHHYTTLQTLQSIQRMTNPNNFPDYVKSRERILDKQQKKNKLNLNGILGDNMYTNIMHSLFNLFSSGHMNNASKIDELKQMECVIDFTLKMNTDLNTISFEMDFLKKANDDLKTGLENLFFQYLKPLGYSESLQYCRTTDSWEELNELVHERFKNIEITNDYEHITKAFDAQLSNYKFSIDQLYFFIHRYDQVISQSVSFYKKFKIMIDNYYNSELCVDRIPVEFVSLKDNIDITIIKFHEAYNPAEFYGSQLKQLLYGD